MAFKLIAAIIAVALMFTYLAPIVLKLGELALTIVVLVGVVMMLVDLWQSLQSKTD